jgi:putative YhdH/YhfP family quinone oxidoreductase
MSSTFRAYRVSKTDTDAATTCQVASISEDTLATFEDSVTIDVHYSSLNYKDALSATGNPGVTKSYPHTPGIDAAGVVRTSTNDQFQAGDEVIVMSYDLGMNTPGGFAEVIRVPANWVMPKPAGISLFESMVLGTAGFTAALALDALIAHGCEPDQGEVVVTGAGGGVGSIAVALLAAQGFEVVASTGKQAAHDLLSTLGASRIIGRDAFSEASSRPMLKGTWAAAVDGVGGVALANIIKSLKYGGAVAAYGLVGGAELDLTVFPFILRGVSLVGIDSAECPMSKRVEIWHKLASDWKLTNLDAIAQTLTLDKLDEAVEAILRGEILGRRVVDVRA